jgi:hypothetical protein
MVKNSFLKLCTAKYKMCNKKYIHNLGYVEVLSENALNKIS